MTPYRPPSHDVPVITVQADSTDRAELDAALDQTVDKHGVPEVAVYNAALVRADELGELSVREHMEAWAVNTVGALNIAEHYWRLHTQPRHLWDHEVLHTSRS